MGSGKGRETLTYDKMGNIGSLVRTDTSSTVVDQLSYSYSGNRLTGVSDAVAGGTSSEPYQLGGSTAYTYDANGNLKSRLNTANTGNNITNVTYNHLNLPNSVTAAGGTVSYTYDALGRKLRSINGIQGQTRDYIEGIEYQNGTFIAESGADMSAFENSDKFSGWTGLRPRNDESAGKYKSTATTKGNKFIRVILVQIAWAAVRTKGSHYQGKFNRLALRKSRKKALIAMARKIGTVLWNMLDSKKPYNPDLLPVYDSARIEAKLIYHDREKQRLQALI